MKRRIPYVNAEVESRDFVEHVFHMLRRAGQLNRSVSIGFSDDVVGNVKTVSSFIKGELSKRFEGIKFVVAPGVARMESQAPDVDGVTYVDCDAVGEFVNVKLLRVRGFDFVGAVV